MRTTNPMRLSLLILFIVSPLLELALLIELGRHIGLWWTILLVVLTAVIGTAVLQQQGLETIGRINRSMAGGEPPIEPVIEGFLLLIAGAFLLTPGIITDGIGFMLLVPPLRRGIARWGMKRVLAAAHVHVRTTAAGEPFSDADEAPTRAPGGQGPVIDGEFERVEDPPQAKAPHQAVKPTVGRNAGR